MHASASGNLEEAALPVMPGKRDSTSRQCDSASQRGDLRRTGWCNASTGGGTLESEHHACRPGDSAARSLLGGAPVRATTSPDLAEAPAHSYRIAATSRRGHIQRVAVTDDEPLERELVCRALSRLTVDIHQASNGVELLELIRCRGPFDVIVTDVSMPRMSGLQALEAARAAGIDTPFIMVSAFGEASLGRQLTLCGAAQFQAKPLDLAHLRQLVAAILADAAPR